MNHIQDLHDYFSLTSEVVLVEICPVMRRGPALLAMRFSERAPIGNQLWLFTRDIFSKLQATADKKEVHTVLRWVRAERLASELESGGNWESCHTTNCDRAGKWQASHALLHFKIPLLFESISAFTVEYGRGNLFLQLYPIV